MALHTRYFHSHTHALAGTALFFIFSIILSHPVQLVLAHTAVVRDRAVSNLVFPRGQAVLQSTALVPRQRSDPDTRQVFAQSFLVYDSNSQTVLFAKNQEDKVSIASLTKLMNALVSYTYVDTRKPFTIQTIPADAVNPILHLQVGDSVLPADLIQAMLVGSANDAALVLGDEVSRVTGRPMVELMNEQAQNIGMFNSHFSNPVGYDSEENYSTALDILTLVKKTEQYPIFDLDSRYTSYSFISEHGAKYKISATNKLIKGHPDIEAIKTGFTDDAQGAMVVRATNKGNPFIIIVLKSGDREGDVLKLKQITEDIFAWEK